MKLQKQISRIVGDKEYVKYVLIIPPDRVKELGWRDGEELTGQIQGKKLTISPKLKADPDRQHRA